MDLIQRFCQPRVIGFSLASGTLAYAGCITNQRIYSYASYAAAIIALREIYYCTTANEVVEEKQVKVGLKEDVLIAFDFDRCLMTRHWFGTYRFNPIAEINPGPSDFAHENIGALFESLLKQEKVHVAVASFGRNDVITKAIASVLPPRLASRVIVCTPADVEGGKDGYSLPSKNPQLNLLAERLNIPTDRICFFDDDRKNIKYANDVGVNAIVADPFNEELEPHIHEHIARFSW